jgi:hypothetical protein
MFSAAAAAAAAALSLFRYTMFSLVENDATEDG